jgi:hypothetical protein
MLSCLFKSFSNVCIQKQEEKQSPLTNFSYSLQPKLSVAKLYFLVPFSKDGEEILRQKTNKTVRLNLKNKQIVLTEIQ